MFPAVVLLLQSRRVVKVNNSTDIPSEGYQVLKQKATDADLKRLKKLMENKLECPYCHSKMTPIISSSGDQVNCSVCEAII